MAKDAKYKGEREVRTFVDLAHGADFLIKKTEQDQKGSYYYIYTTMSSLLLIAFTFEAYLNHLGKKKIKFWKEIEPIKVMDKYSILCKEFEINPDDSRRPYQTLISLFKFRNSIAHGKSEILKETKTVSSQDDPFTHAPRTKWEEYCELDNAKRAIKDISSIINELHKAAGLGNDAFRQGMTTSSVSMKSFNK
jgi:hypothetical protein